jgi:hypothetical protein
LSIAGVDRRVNCLPVLPPHRDQDPDRDGAKQLTVGANALGRGGALLRQQFEDLLAWGFASLSSCSRALSC